MWVDILLNLFYWRKLKIWISFLWNKKCIKYWWTVDHMYCKTFENVTHQDGGDERSPWEVPASVVRVRPYHDVTYPHSNPKQGQAGGYHGVLPQNDHRGIAACKKCFWKKKQSNYKGRTNCYKVIISWEKNPLNLWILRLFWRKLLCRLSESWNLRSV